MRWDELNQQSCSVARTLAVIGDRWTLMILRDCFFWESDDSTYLSNAWALHVMSYLPSS